jgi:DNA end-binding protein Ku
MVGMARVVLYGRERIVTLEPRGKGILVTTLHYAYEIRDDAELFADIPSKEPPRELLDLASHIIDTKVGHFRPMGFKDAYQDAVLALIHAKQKGKAAPAPAHAKTESNVINLADALRRSLGGGATKRESRVKKVKIKGAKAKTTAKPAPAKRRGAKAPRSPARKTS